MLSMEAKSCRKLASVSMSFFPISAHWAPWPLKIIVMAGGTTEALERLDVWSSPFCQMANARWGSRSRRTAKVYAMSEMASGWSRA